MTLKPRFTVRLHLRMRSSFNTARGDHVKQYYICVCFKSRYVVVYVRGSCFGPKMREYAVAMDLLLYLQNPLSKPIYYTFLISAARSF